MQLVQVAIVVSQVLQLTIVQTVHVPDTNPNDSLQPVQMPGAAGQVRQFISVQTIVAEQTLEANVKYS